MATFEQETFGAGIFRGRMAPSGSVYDALNALVNDEGLLVKRGMGAWFSDFAGLALDGLAVVQLAVGERILIWGAGYFGYVDPGTGALTTISTTTVPAARQRVSMVDGIVLFIDRLGTYTGWAGSAKPFYSVGTATVTPGSATVTGATTGWTANVDAGMVLRMNGGGSAVVKSVDTDTQITLTRLWQGPAIAAGGYSLHQFPQISFDAGPVTALAGTSLQSRALIGVGNRIYFGDAWHPFDLQDYRNELELPRGALIRGMEGVGEDALIFSTGGVWRLSGTSFDVVDDAGNLQWQLQPVTSQVILWGDPGVAAYETQLLVPALDDIYMMGLDGVVGVVSQGVRSAYRDYVEAGYVPGKATVHRGHYLLPIVSGTTVVDELVCRIDRPFETESGAVRPWTRWDGFAAGLCVTSRVTSDGTRLLGLGFERVKDLTVCLAPDGVELLDADSTTPTFRVDFNDDDLGPGIRPNTAEKVRFVYETTGGTPTVSVGYATGPEGSSYVAAVAKRGGGASDGTDYSAWRVGKKAERIRFRFECASQVTSLILRRREVTVRMAAQS